MYVDMNCQQICKISRKALIEVKIFQKVLEGYFFETPCILPDKSLLLNLLFIILEYFETVPRYFSIIA